MKPGDYVLVTLLGTNYRGRILQVRQSTGGTFYYVQYTDDRAEFKTADFDADELKLVDISGGKPWPKE